jgi:beta-barrel assembly-enhancing protease
MSRNLATERLKLSRRDFLIMSGLSAAGVLTGCATNPVTGKTELMLVTQQGEIDMDKQNSPHQFSSDYGACQDMQLNAYLSEVGSSIVGVSHRPNMPYSFRCVNATYVNAYAFPGGSIAATRGILIKLDNEAELAALLGHEVAHVNFRHTASQMSKNIVAMAVIAGLTVYMEERRSKYAPLAAGLGMVATGLMLASYSRQDEREADDYGLDYIVKAGYGAAGFVLLMDMLRSLSGQKAGALELMFATHPMSEERYQTSLQKARTQYSQSEQNKVNRERYMDRTAPLRAQKDAIELMQRGEEAITLQRFSDAESNLKSALKKAPEDYAGLLMLSKCYLAQERYDEALQYANRAHEVYPQEPQAYHVAGILQLQKGQYELSLQAFSNYEKTLPGNPNTIFFKGLSFEGMGRTPKAADEYQKYLQSAPQGEFSEHATQALVDWGYVEKQQEQPQQQPKTDEKKSKYDWDHM